MSKAGRPTKFKPEYVEQAYQACARLGATDKDLAAIFNATEKTINLWKRTNPEFLQSVKRGKQEFDTDRVGNALLKRALGFEYEETHFENPAAKFKLVKRVIKYQAPDTTACIFWLKNRGSERWRGRQGHVRDISGDLTGHLARWKRRLAEDG